MCTGTHDFIPAPGVAKLEFVYEQEGQQMENVLHFHQDAEWTASDLALLCSAGASAWATDLAPQIAVNVVNILVKATDMEVEGGAYAEFFPVSSPGSMGGTALPNGISIRIRATTGTTGRTRRGGPFHVGLVTACLDTTNYNDITTTYATDVTGAWQAFKSSLEAINGSKMVITSYCLNNVWRTVAVSTPVVALSVSDLHLDRQWRRMPPRGN